MREENDQDQVLSEAEQIAAELRASLTKMKNQLDETRKAELAATEIAPAALAEAKSADDFNITQKTVNEPSRKVAKLSEWVKKQVKTETKTELAEKYEEEKQENTDIKTKKPNLKSWIVIGVVIWLLVVAGSYGVIFYTLQAREKALEAFVETKMAEIVADNKVAIASMEESLAVMEADVAAVTEYLADTDAAISTSAAANREAMTEKIAELDAQLKKLEASLKILEADANRGD